MLIDFLCTVTGGELRAGSDADEVRWIARPELDSAVESLRLRETLLAVIRKGFDQARMLA